MYATRRQGSFAWLVSLLCLPGLAVAEAPLPAAEQISPGENPAADDLVQVPVARGSRPSERVQAVQDAASNRFSLASHKSSYLLPAAYSGTSDNPGYDGGEGRDFKSLEIEFQLSVQVPLWSGVLGPSSFVSAAYTNRSFWQAYTPSAPLRETVHEPELILTWLSDWRLFGLECVASQLAFSHQSNGRDGDQSRGWNRVYAKFIFERDAYFLAFRPWYRIPEDRIGDDNPDIDFFLGNFELSGGYRGDSYGASILVRNNLRSDNRGAVELRWNFPVGPRLRGFVRYFNGYGEGLANYDRAQESLGLGIELAEGF